MGALRRTRNAFIVLSIVGPTWSAPCFASTTESAQTAGRLLTESVGARPSGLAEAGTALVGDLNALSFNPAGLPFMKRSEAMARYQTMLGDVTSGALACGGRSGRMGWGAGTSYLDAGTINLAFSDGRPSESRSAEQDVTGQVSAGYLVTDFLSLGVGGRYIHSTLVQDYHASAFAGDAGFVVQMPVKGWRLAGAVRNMGGRLKYKETGDPLPGETRVGTSFAYSPSGVAPEEPATEDEWYQRDENGTPIFTVLVDGVRDRAGNLSGAAAFELTQWPRAAFRAGYGWGENATGLTLGFGANFLSWSLDYSWRLINDFSGAHRISFSMYWE
jgi:hypothetical protein